MKILVYSINWAPELSGIGKFTGEMTDWLAARGHQVRIVAAPPYYPEWRVADNYSAVRYRRETRDGVRAWRCPLYVPRKTNGWRRVLHLASFALSSAPVVLSHVFWRPDVIMAIEPPLACAPMALVAARLSGAIAWLHVQDYELDAAFELGIVKGDRLKRWLRKIEHWLMRKFDRVSSISEGMVDRLLDKGLPLETTVLFPNWVNCDLIYPLGRPSAYRRQLGLDEATPVALYSGNMGVKQGLEIVIETALKLADRNYVFVLCGAGADYQALRRRAEGLQNVRWLPLQPHENLNELLNLADVHLLPQRGDAAELVMPSKMTGILASGRAVVATAKKGTSLARVVEDVGVVVPPGDIDAFSTEVDKLMQDADRRHRLGMLGRQYALQHLGQEMILRQFEAQLEIGLSRFFLQGSCT